MRPKWRFTLIVFMRPEMRAIRSFFAFGGDLALLMCCIAFHLEPIPFFIFTLRTIRIDFLLYFIGVCQFAKSVFYEEYDGHRKHMNPKFATILWSIALISDTGFVVYCMALHTHPIILIIFTLRTIGSDFLQILFRISILNKSLSDEEKDNTHD